MASNAAALIPRPAPERREFNVVLQPVSHPELGEICIEDDLFAVGRTEAPFASYRPELVSGLSRRHARVFIEGGAVYVADLDSKNGTTVNGVEVRQKPAALRHGDEVRFGADLSYRVQLDPRADAPERAAKLVSLTLTPVQDEPGIQPIVLTRFPFLIGKSDDTFSRYQDRFPQQVSYISRRQAHIFVKGATPFVEDVGSTNGTYLNGKRLDEHAVPFDDGDLLTFGGAPFVYRATLKRAPEVDTTVTILPRAVPEAGDSEKTTFVVSATSFLDIFCVDRAAEQAEASNDEGAKPAEDAGQEPGKRRPRGKFAILLAELMDAFLGAERTGLRRAIWGGASAAAVLAIFVLSLYLWGAAEREVRDSFARGEYALAAKAADEYLARHPDDAEIKALGTEALLKGSVPDWLSLLGARDFDRASAAIDGMKQLSGHNAEARALVRELEWMGALQAFVIGRGGVDAPIRIYADEDRMSAVLRYWNEDTQGHQRAFATISSYVPAFKDAYADALSHLRKLQNDDSVYLPAIERLKATIRAELDRDSPEALEAVLKEYAAKYPRLDGLDGVRSDLRQYVAIENEARARRLGRLAVLMANARFSTPPFQVRFRALSSSDRFPPLDVVRQFEAVSEAWRAGDAKLTFDGLQQMATGAWADAAAKEFERKRVTMEQFVALEKARGAGGFEERLLKFHGALDPDEDAYFLRAIEEDVGRYRDRALARAQESLRRAGALWRQYREAGAIDVRQRLKAELANEFRTQARLLADANDEAQAGMRIYAQLKVAHPVQWVKVHDEIGAEAARQRKALLDLRHVLEPATFKTKLTLLGEQ